MAAYRRFQNKKASAGQSRAHFLRRLSVLTALFVLACLVFCITLIGLQVGKKGFTVYAPAGETAGHTVKLVPLQALRGEILDRNGEPLVTNRVAYDACLSYDSFGAQGGATARNRVLLSIACFLDEQDGLSRPTELFPLVGEYPDLSLNDAAQDVTSPVYYQMTRVLRALDIQAVSADALVAYYVRHNDLNAQIDGVPLYSGAQITQLIRLYYELDRYGFAAEGYYPLAEDISTSLIAALKEAQLPCVTILSRTVRVLHYPDSTAALMGEVQTLQGQGSICYNAQGESARTSVGISGCESAFEQYLCGEAGELRLVLDQTGAIVSQEVIRQPTPGADVYLSLDISMQLAAHTALSTVTSATVGGCAVVLSPQDGSPLAIVTRNTAADELTRNRALDQSFSPATALTALRVAAGGTADALTLSLMRAAGLGQKSGIELGEQPGFLHTDCPIVHDSDTRVTALQLCRVLSVTLNAGNSYDCRLLYEVRDSRDQSVLYHAQPTAQPAFPMTDATVEQLMQDMEAHAAQNELWQPQSLSVGVRLSPDADEPLTVGTAQQSVLLASVRAQSSSRPALVGCMVVDGTDALSSLLSAWNTLMQELYAK